MHTTRIQKHDTVTRKKASERVCERVRECVREKERGISRHICRLGISVEIGWLLADNKTTRPDQSACNLFRFAHLTRMTNRSSLPHTAYPSFWVLHDKEYFMRLTDAPDGLSSKHTESVSRVLLTTACKRVHARACFMVRMIVYGELEPRAIMYNVDLFILVHGPSSSKLMTTMIRPLFHCRPFSCARFPTCVLLRGLQLYSELRIIVLLSIKLLGY